MDPETRESLIARLPNHADTAAWEEFVQLYEPLIYGIGRRHGLQPTDAADLVQEVFLAVAGSIHRFEPDEHRGRFRTWLFQVARNQALLRLRALRVHDRVTGGGEGVSLDDCADPRYPENEFDIAFRRRAFRWAARRVRETVQQTTWDAFAKTTIDCHPPAHVAETLGIPIGSVYLARSRVMGRLKRLVQEVSGEVIAAEHSSGSHDAVHWGETP